MTTKNFHNPFSPQLLTFSKGTAIGRRGGLYQHLLPYACIPNEVKLHYVFIFNIFVKCRLFYWGRIFGILERGV